MFNKNQSSGRANESGDYKDKIRVHRTKKLYRALLIIVVVGVVALIVRLQYVNHVYTGYEIANSVERNSTYDSVDMRLGKSILTYSKDGAHCADSKGNVLWNQTYEIQDLKMATAGSIVGIASYNGRNIFILNENEQMCRITTTMPIRDLCVAENGTSTVVIYDTNVTYLNTYNSEGNMIFNGQTHMSNSGYPAAIGLSPNGKMLAVGYMYVDAGTVKTTVAFYNFGSVGDNYTDYLVSGFDYTDLIVPQVGFLSNSMAYAIGDNRIMFYSGDEQPTVKAEYLLEQEILSAFSGNGYLGVVFAANSEDGRYRMSIYNNSGELKGDYYFDIDYTDIFFEKNTFVVYNESECLIRTYDGKDKFVGTFDMSVHVMMPTDKAYCYVIADDKTIETIQLN
ncbi:MAG: DUF5711 family protein [Lachnospiraceae bacterium]|nr:DUF5711 family protein [Lachnospiraceae bacterium]